MNIGGFLAALALGFVAGAIARALIPNDAFRHMHGMRSWLTSAGLGLLGALVGYWIFHGIFGIGDTDKFDWGGIVGAVIGAVIVVALASFLIKRFAKPGSTDDIEGWQPFSQVRPPLSLPGSCTYQVQPSTAPIRALTC
jgi:uncharacterized membrane protein YeaQ/YmgE (transglycosylase-associated protein family)